LSDIEDERKEADGELVKTYDLQESAASMDRESLEEIATFAEEDKFDILGVWKLDRLTRASPWDTIMYLDRLREAGVILYAHTHGYFEWDNLYDFEMLARRVIFAREWYQRIIEGGRDGQQELLEEGKWPFGTPPHGYTKDDDQVIMFTENGKEINQEISQLYLAHENMERVETEINERHEKDISITQIRNILQNPILVGDLTLEGQTVRHDEGLKVIGREKFEKIQNIREKYSSTPSNARDIPEAIDRAANRFGVEYVTDLIDSIGIQCRKCGSELRHNGSIVQWNTKLRKYACTNDGCDHEGPLLKQTEFDELHQTLPLRCPYCPSTDCYEVEERSSGFWKYKYTCVNCGESFASDASPNKIRQAMEKPTLAFKWDGKTDPPQNEETESESTTESEVPDQSQKTFAAY